MKMNVLLRAMLLVAGAAIPAAGITEASAAAVPPLEELPRRPIDTLDTDDGRHVVIYTNNTWSYCYDDEASLIDAPVYRDHWTNTQLFAYMDVQLKDLPAVIDLKLIDDLDDFSAPIVGRIFGRYGRRGRRSHNGVDLPLKVGEPIRAAFSGKVRYAHWNTGGFGNLVIIRHENGLETWYAHLTRCNVEENSYVKAGDVIGFGGSTGRSSGPHLHFEVRYCDQTFDPEHLIDFETGELHYQTFALDKKFFNINSRASETLDEDTDLDGMMASGDGAGLSSEEILDTIEKSQQAAVQEQKRQSDPLYHTIRCGEYLGKIARQYGTTVKKLCQLNGISENTVIREGKKLRVR